MDDNLNSGELNDSSKCDNSGQVEEEEWKAGENELLSREDAPPAGRMVEEPAAWPGESNDNASRKARPPNLVKCDICLCEMSSDLVLTSHINGSRHKKRMKALEIVANLKAAGEKGIGLTDNGSSAYRCEVCSLSVNSPQQLEIHLAGAKHKNRMAREKLFNIVVNVTTHNSKAESVNNGYCPPLKKRKKDGKVLYCDICNIMVNSETQYEQHVISKKHLGRAKGDNNRKKRLNRLDNKSNLIQKSSADNRFHGSNEPDGNNSQVDMANPQFPPNSMNRLHKVHSQQNNRSSISVYQMKTSGMSNGPPFGNYYHPRPYLNNHRNLGNNFCRMPEIGKFVPKPRPQPFNSHPDSLLQSSTTNS